MLNVERLPYKNLDIKTVLVIVYLSRHTITQCIVTRNMYSNKNELFLIPLHNKLPEVSI